MSKKLFLIEAPGKLKKLRQILGSEYIVKASGGHIRELAKDGDDNLGFDLNEHHISCRFVFILAFLLRNGSNFRDTFKYF